MEINIPEEIVTSLEDLDLEILSLRNLVLNMMLADSHDCRLPVEKLAN